jgi:electron transfer flavoprotein beta subunit
MKIAVCVKQVPQIAEVKVNPETGTLVREGVASILNPFCEYALDHAVRIKSARPDVTILAISMGPPQARAALMRCLELGADEALLLCDRKFAGSDSWATALTLASAIKAVAADFDLILMGKQAIDGDTAQVGPEVAEILGIPQITYAVDIEISANGKRLNARRECESGSEVVTVRMPVLVSAVKGETLRRLPSFAEVLAARRKPLRTMNADAMPLKESELGLQGSFTQVVKVFPPSARKSGQRVEGLEAVDAARVMVEFLRAERFI